MSAIVTYPDTYNRFADSSKITLDKINQGINGTGGGGGGGTGGIAMQVYQDRAPAPPDNIARPAISYSSADQVISQWTGSAWV